MKVNKEKIDNNIKAEMKAGQIPGLAYAVVMNGKIIDSGAYGLSNVELKSPVTMRTKFNLGSVGKTFTATAIMLLVKEGKLSLDDPINKHLDSLPDSWKQITVRNLLSHTSGIRDYVGDFPGYPLIEKRDRKRDYKEAEFIRMATELPLNFTPGERYAYSNSNFVLLGFIVHKISGETLPAFMKKNVFDKLGMHETVYMTQTDIIPNRAHGYLLNDSNKLINGNYISDFFSSTGDMGVTTTAGDMAKWSLALGSGKILGKETLAQMWTPEKLSNGGVSNFFGGTYGLGWNISDHRGYKEIGHSGSFMNGYTANYKRFDDLNLTVIILTNLNPTNIGRLSYSIAGSFVPGLSGIEHIKPATTTDKSSVEKVKLILTGIITDKIETALVTEDFIKRINPITRSIMVDTAHLPSVTYISSDMVTNRKLYRYNIPIEKINYYKLEFPGETAWLSLYITADNKIADWRVY